MPLYLVLYLLSVSQQLYFYSLKLIFSIQLIDHMTFNWDIEIYLDFNIHALSEREVD